MDILEHDIPSFLPGNGNRYRKLIKGRYITQTVTQSTTVSKKSSQLCNKTHPGKQPGKYGLKCKILNIKLTEKKKAIRCLEDSFFIIQIQHGRGETGGSRCRSQHGVGHTSQKSMQTMTRYLWGGAAGCTFLPGSR